jgi:hypothetical protein
MNLIVLHFNLLIPDFFIQKVKIMNFRKYIVLAVIFFLISLDIRCSVLQTVAEDKFVTGEVEVVGNEPFTKIALRINSAEVYYLQCDKETERILLQAQGKKAKIFYNKIDDSQKPNTILVKRAEFITSY